MNSLTILRALGAGNLVGALGRALSAAEGAEAALRKVPELAELRAALDDLRRALRNR